MIAALMLASVMGSGAPTVPAPIYLTTTSVGESIRFQIVGAPTAAYRASFTLEVNSEGNQSRHHGSAELRPGDQAVLSTVTVGVRAQGKWSARLRVEPVGGEPYEQVAASS
jgi:hypothetical protein